MQEKLWPLLIVLLAICSIAGWKWHKTQSRDNMLFFAFMILLTATLYSVGVLGMRITGLNTTVEMIERTKSEVLVTKQDVAKIAAVIIKSAFVLSDGSSRIGGTPPEHKAKLEEYGKELAELTKQNRGELMGEVNRTLQELNDSIKKRAHKP